MNTFRRGDRVRATHKNGDVAEFVVATKYSNGTLASEFGTICSEDEGWSFERIEKPLPTEPGLYQCRNTILDPTMLRVVILGTDGEWSEKGIHSKPPKEMLKVVKEWNEKHGLVRLVWED